MKHYVWGKIKAPNDPNVFDFNLLEYYSPLLGVEISKQKEYLTDGLFEYQDSPLKMVIEFSFPKASCQDQVKLPFHKYLLGPHHAGKQGPQHLLHLLQKELTGLPLHLWEAPDRNPHVSQDAEDLPWDHGVPLQVPQGLVDVQLLPQHVLDGGEDECFPSAKFIEIWWQKSMKLYF
jgi:hypothetical protein